MDFSYFTLEDSRIFGNVKKSKHRRKYAEQLKRLGKKALWTKMDLTGFDIFTLLKPSLKLRVLI